VNTIQNLIIIGIVSCLNGGGLTWSIHYGVGEHYENCVLLHITYSNEILYCDLMKRKWDMIFGSFCHTH
jgi:hypothetical protein